MGTIAAASITKENIRYNPKTKVYDFDDESALSLVLNDAEDTDNFININQWASRWTESDTLLQSPTSSYGQGSGFTVPKFTLSNTVATLVSKIMLGMFYDDPPFLLRPRADTSQFIVNCKTSLFAYQLDDMKFMEEIETGWEQCALLGTMVFKWGWEKKTKIVPTFKEKSKAVPVNTAFKTEHVHTPDSMDFDIEYDEEDVARPWLKACDIRSEVLVNKATRRGDIRKAKEVIYRGFPTWKEVEDFRGQQGYTIPDREELEEFFLNRTGTPQGDNLAMTLPENMRGYLQHAPPRNYKATADPFQNGIELLERVDQEKKIVVLRMGEHNILIYNGPNEYSKINYLSCNWRNLPDAFYGQGLGQLIGTEQMVEQGTTALALGMLAYGLQPTFIRKKGFNAISQPTIWEQGGVIDVEDDVEKAYKVLEYPSVPTEAWQFIAQSKSDSAETSGANQQTSMGAGAAGIKTTGMRSGTGAALVGQASASRLDGPVERFIRQVFVPWLYEMDQLNNKLLPTKILMEILGEEMGTQFKKEEFKHIDFRNAKIEYDVLAGAHLGAKKEMAQFLPFVMQLVNNPTLMEQAAEQGLAFNFKGWFEQFSHLAGYAFAQEFFIKADTQTMQKRMANSPAGIAAAKKQQAQQSEVQKFQQSQQLLDQEQIGKGANEAQRIILEHVLDTGSEGGEGVFGTAEQ